MALVRQMKGARSKRAWSRWPEKPEHHNIPMMRIHGALQAAEMRATIQKGAKLTREESHMVRLVFDTVLAWVETGTRRVTLCPMKDCKYFIEEDDALVCPEHGPIQQSPFFGPRVNVAVIFDFLPQDYHEVFKELRKQMPHES